MDILSQFLVSSSVYRSSRLLAAPPVRLALPAPRIAGLLTAGAAPQHASGADYLVFDRRPSWDDIEAQLTCPSLEDMDAEIVALIAEHREAKRRQYAARVPRPAVREV